MGPIPPQPPGGGVTVGKIAAGTCLGIILAGCLPVFLLLGACAIIAVPAAKHSTELFHKGQVGQFVQASGRGDIAGMKRELGSDTKCVNELDSDGYGALHAAARWGQVQSVRLLLDSGADVNLPDKDGRTALDYAKESRHEEVIKLLSEHRPTKAPPLAGETRQGGR